MRNSEGTEWTLDKCHRMLFKFASDGSVEHIDTLKQILLSEQKQGAKRLSCHTSASNFGALRDEKQRTLLHVAAKKGRSETISADDIVLTFEEEEKTQVFLDELAKVILSFGMHFAPTKCKVMLVDVQSLNPPFTIQGEVLEVVERFTYLGSCISPDCSVTDEVNARICKARAASANLRYLWRQNGLSLNLKGRVYQATVRAVLLYGCETWPIRAADLRRLQVFDNRCLRTIARVGSPPHELARFLAGILKPLTGKSSTYIKNSYDFANKVAGVTVEPDDILVSFDVNSLYTNVPKGDSLEIAKRLLLADTTLSERTQLTVDEIVEGIKACLNLTHFVFDSVVYTQEQGLTMGSPIFPVLANIFMEEFEQRALAGFPHPPKIFWRYVDDTFVVMKRDKVNEFYNYLNELSPQIKFSMEIESTSGKLAFLDCMTHKVGGRLKTTVYEKPTDTGAVLNYSSAHPKSVFASIASSMFRRVRALCTEEADRTAAQIEVKNKLRGSGYPASLIRRQLRRVLIPVEKPNREWIGTAVIPYKPGTSEKLPSMEAEKLRVQLVTVLKSQQPGVPNIAPAERRALNTLKNVDSIVITKADKGCEVLRVLLKTSPSLLTTPNRHGQRPTELLQTLFDSANEEERKEGDKILMSEMATESTSSRYLTNPQADESTSFCRTAECAFFDEDESYEGFTHTEPSYAWEDYFSGFSDQPWKSHLDTIREEFELRNRSSVPRDNATRKNAPTPEPSTDEQRASFFRRHEAAISRKRASQAEITLEQFQEKWNQFTLLDTQIASIAEIPWPPFCDKIERTNQRSSAELRIDAVLKFVGDSVQSLRRLQVDWHPDRFSSRFGARLKAELKQEVGKKVVAISQLLNTAMDTLRKRQS
ncbi:hypothetical protein T265_07200 [Opisthorchis viverrini]|uniref:Reverse transcriptase domain-containing protein n=1 Tax=Opisthorchis viverrini TaxID=6198 RepID=A0A074ZPS6_OPIVI|nr:hypothetical protein T265_07200 [Opisthorchis viverrini]KER25325.1 hypothetical protein T265_07200 [Opisthorchis viverrini]